MQEGKDPMSKQESTKEIIDSYRKKQNQSWQNIALFVGAALLIILGAAFLITWLTGAKLDIGGIFCIQNAYSHNHIYPQPGSAHCHDHIDTDGITADRYTCAQPNGNPFWSGDLYR